jgi:hypothetical protein
MGRGARRGGPAVASRLGRELAESSRDAGAHPYESGFAFGERLAAARATRAAREGRADHGVAAGGAHAAVTAGGPGPAGAAHGSTRATGPAVTAGAGCGRSGIGKAVAGSPAASAGAAGSAGSAGDRTKAAAVARAAAGATSATQGDTYGVFSGRGPRALPTSVPADGRQSPQIPTVVVAPNNNGELVAREPRTELTSVVNLIATERTVGTRKRGRN